MTAHDLFELSKEAVLLVAVLSLPVAAAVVGAAALSAVFQSFTKISDPALSAVPRLIIGAAVFILALPWIGARAIAFAERAWSLLPLLHP